MVVVTSYMYYTTCRAYFSRDLNFANDSKIGFHGTLFCEKLSVAARAMPIVYLVGTFLVFNFHKMVASFAKLVCKI